MKILITGGLGYLGSYLIRKLPALFPKSPIIILDNLATGKFQSLQNLPQGNYQFLEKDIRTFDYHTLPFGAGDCVIHFAALSKPENSFDQAKDYEAINFEGTVRLARFCEKTGANLFFPSSTSVYHRTDGGWIESCEQFLRPATPYAMYKLKAERKLATFKKLRYTLARFGTIFGNAAGNSYSTAVNRFCWQAVTRQPLTVWETAWDQYRPYLAIEDASRFILEILQKKRFDRETYQIASENATVSTLVKMIGRHIPDLQVQKVKTKAMNDLSYKVLSSDLSALNFKPSGSIERGIRELIFSLKGLPKFSKKVGRRT